MVLISPPLILIMLQTEVILRTLGQEPALAADAGRFVAMLCFGLPFTLGFQVLRNYATALDRPNAALWVMAAMIGVNGVLAWALIFGELGLPALGLTGAGIATAISSAFSFFAMLGLILALPDLRKHRILRRFHRPVWPRLSELFRLGVPIGLTLMFEAMLFNTMTLLVGTFGARPLAAHQIALNFASVTFMVPLGIALAATVRVGRFAGAGDAEGARRAGFTAMIVATISILGFGVLMAFNGDWIASLYVSGRTPADLEVIALAGVFLQVAAAFQLFDALQVVGALSLRGLKDARAPMFLAAGSYWLAGAPMCVFLGVGLGLQGLGVWIGLAFGLAVAAAAMCGRFALLTRRGRLAVAA
jgi:MATE family multidrug resistance protein